MWPSRDCRLKEIMFTNCVSFSCSFLYTILADKAIANLPVVILCNKQDETLAKGDGVIKSLLEKEM